MTEESERGTHETATIQNTITQGNQIAPPLLTGRSGTVLTQVNGRTSETDRPLRVKATARRTNRPRVWGFSEPFKYAQG